MHQSCSVPNLLTLFFHLVRRQARPFDPLSDLLFTAHELAVIFSPELEPNLRCFWDWLWLFHGVDVAVEGGATDS